MARSELQWRAQRAANLLSECVKFLAIVRDLPAPPLTSQQAVQINSSVVTLNALIQALLAFSHASTPVISRTRKAIR
jgi:hypothetical protein